MERVIGVQAKLRQAVPLGTEKEQVKNTRVVWFWQKSVKHWDGALGKMRL